MGIGLPPARFSRHLRRSDSDVPCRGRGGVRSPQEQGERIVHAYHLPAPDRGYTAATFAKYESYESVKNRLLSIGKNTRHSYRLSESSRPKRGKEPQKSVRVSGLRRFLDPFFACSRTRRLDRHRFLVPLGLFLSLLLTGTWRRALLPIGAKTSIRIVRDKCTQSMTSF